MIDLITWKYDPSIAPHVSGQTQSFRAVGTMRVGDICGEHSHMSVIHIKTMEVPSYMRSENDCPRCGWTHKYTPCHYATTGKA